MWLPRQPPGAMAFIPLTTFLPKPYSQYHTQSLTCAPSSQSTRRGILASAAGGKGKKPAKNRRFRPGKGIPSQKTKLEPETVFLETGPSKYELIIPTLSILTVIGIIPFAAALARAAWVRYKITSRRISISSGFQGKDQTEIIYRDIDSIKFVRRLGGAADCVLTLKDGAKLEIRSIPEFDKVYEYILTKLDENARQASGPA